MAKALPPSLEKLQLTDTGCGDGGLVALAAAFPSLVHLQLLYCGSTPAATSRGWVALAGALPSLPVLEELNAKEMHYHRVNTGMGPEGAAALALALPQCPVLRHVTVMDPYPRVPVTEPGFVALRKAAQQIRERCIKEAAEERRRRRSGVGSGAGGGAGRGEDEEHIVVESSKRRRKRQAKQAKRLRKRSYSTSSYWY